MAVVNVTYDAVPQTEENGDAKTTTSPASKGFGVRHTQSLILFTCLTVGLMMRAHLSVSLVAMTSNTTLQMWYPDYCINEFSISEGNETVMVKREDIDSIQIDGINNSEQSMTDNINEDINKANTNVNNKNSNKTVLKDGDFNDDQNHEKSVNQTKDGIPVVVKERDVYCNEFKKKMEGYTVYRTYNWHKGTQEMILFSFFVGYTTMMIPMGIVAQRFGGKIPIMIALGANGVLSTLTPWMPIFSGWLGVCAVRLLQGMTQAAFYPSIQTMLSRWAPLNERGRLSSYIYGGSQFGTVLAFQLSGLFAGSPSFGWPVSFWFCGVLSFACFGLLAWLGAATPYDHPSISDEEIMYIAGDGSADLKLKKRHTPWKQILTSSAVWGLVTTHVGSAMGYLFILTEIPLYMNKILGVDIKENGVFSSLPYISMYVTSIFFGYLADWALNKKIMSLANIRRVANSIGMIGLSIFLVAFGCANSTLTCVILMMLCLSTHSGIHVGFLINSIDLAPNFAGSIMALGNMSANLVSLTMPVMVSYIIGDDVTNQHKWQIMFWIVAAIQVVTNTVYVVFAKGDVQSWNFYDGDKEGAEKENMVLTEKNIIKVDLK